MLGMVRVVKERSDLTEANRNEEHMITHKRIFSPPGAVEEWERTNSEQFWQQLGSLSFARRNNAMRVSHNILVITQHILDLSRNNHYLLRPGDEPGIFGCWFIFWSMQRPWPLGYCAPHPVAVKWNTSNQDVGGWGSGCSKSGRAYASWSRNRGFESCCMMGFLYSLSFSIPL